MCEKWDNDIQKRSTLWDGVMAWWVGPWVVFIFSFLVYVLFWFFFLEEENIRFMRMQKSSGIIISFRKLNNKIYYERLLHISFSFFILILKIVETIFISSTYGICQSKLYNPCYLSPIICLLFLTSPTICLLENNFIEILMGQMCILMYTFITIMNYGNGNGPSVN